MGFKRCKVLKHLRRNNTILKQILTMDPHVNHTLDRTSYNREIKFEIITVHHNQYPNTPSIGKGRILSAIGSPSRLEKFKKASRTHCQILDATNMSSKG